MKTLKRKFWHLAGCFLLTAFLAGCTPSVKGVYACKGGFLESIELGSGGKAFVNANMFGMKQQKVGTYTVNKDRVIITIQGESNAFTHDGKTLDGGPLLGTCTAD